LATHILVTGGAGFIGSNFVHYLTRAHPDWRITNFDKLTYAGSLANLEGMESHPGYRCVRGDICDREAV
jgi:dTDP-glucose 4,6-dehydratase